MQVHVALKVCDTSLISLPQNNLLTSSPVDRDNVQHYGDGTCFHLQVEEKLYSATIKLPLILNIYHTREFTLLLT
jgi:hypothetical protein